MLTVESLKFYYSRNQVVLKDVSFKLKLHDILCLLGPNGTGKTTLLRCLLGLNKPARGIIRINEKDITRTSSGQKAQYMAYVPQATSMAFPYDTEEIVLMGRTAHLKLGSSPTPKDRQICREAMESLGILHLEGKSFNNLSGGERQLVLVARAMAQQARILIMDEPTANLDYSNQVRILRIINQLAEQGYSILMTTHFPDHAFLASNRVILMRDGLIMADGTPEDIVTSENLSKLYQTRVCVTEATLYPDQDKAKVCIPIIKKISMEKETH